MPRRAALRALGVWGLAWAGVGCIGTSDPSGRPGPGSGTAKPAAPLTVVVANSELVAGPNRLALGLLDSGNRPITDAEVQLRLFQIQGELATLRAESQAVFRWVEIQNKGVYSARTEFDAPGPWGVEVEARRAGNVEPLIARVSLDVKSQGRAPTVGSAAPRSRSPLASEVADLAEICSNVPPCPQHTLSIDTALAGGRPSVITFATPGYCVTQTCAPQLGVVLGMAPRYADRMDFIHVEIYKDPRQRTLADPVVEWALPSEPWVFIVDRAGRIADRFEGVATADELEESLQAVM